MLLCNTTFCVEDHVTPQFLNWIKNIFIPAVNSQKTFSDPLFVKIAHKESDNVTSYALQFKANDHSFASDWHKETALSLYDELCSRIGKEKVLPFVTFMEIIE